MTKGYELTLQEMIQWFLLQTLFTGAGKTVTRVIATKAWVDDAGS